MIATLVVAIAVLIVSAIAVWWVVRRGAGPGWLRIAVSVLLAFPLCFSLFLASYISYYLAIPASPATCLADVEGITLSNFIATDDDPKHIVIAKVDLQKFAIGLSPPDLNDPQLRFPAMNTSDALRKYGGVLAVNASFFRPFRDKHLFDYFPHDGDLVEAIGLTVSDSKKITEPNNWPVLWLAEGRLRIGESHTAGAALVNSKVEMAVSGKSLLIKDGVAVATPGGNPYPRTAAGLDASGNYLWLVVVDGKQPGHSEGIKLDELAQLMLDMGVADAIELDGGGSSTMAAARNGKSKVLNRPSHTNLPARERPVANHLIVRER